MHHSQDLIRIFNTLFLESHNTQLVCCQNEPIYLPADASHPHHRIIFAHGFYASALHEIAHWLVAGPARRLQEDYGYWYKPDGRNADEQLLFEQVEIKPQAIEWVLSTAAGFKFNFSADNLNGGTGVTEQFKLAVWEQARRYIREGFRDERAERLTQALLGEYRREHTRLDETELHCPVDISCDQAL